jgi:hypothetical protein
MQVAKCVFVYLTEQMRDREEKKRSLDAQWLIFLLEEILHYYLQAKRKRQ